MTISITSTTDSAEAVTAAMGNLASKEVVAETPKDAPIPEPSEAVDDTEVIEPEVEASEEDEEEAEELEETEDETEDPKPKKKGGFQKRIDKLNKKLSAADQEKEYWRQEALRTKSNPEPEKKANDEKPDLNKPKAETFATHDEYVEALTDWKLDQKLLERERKQKEHAVKSESETKINTHRARVDEFSKSKEDWDDVTEVFSKAPISITLQEAVVNSDHGPEMLYELGKDPKELKRILALPPIQAAMALGKIESRYSKSNPSNDKKLTTKAPPPVTPVKGKGSSATKSIYDADKMTQREWDQLRNEQIKARREGRV